MKRLLVVAVAALGLTACTDTDKAGWAAYGMAHHIKQFSGGQVVGEWTSTGKVQNEEHSDGYRFEDAKTHKIVEVSGAVQITLE